MKQMKVSKTKLAEQYETMPISDLARHYEVCLTSLYKLLDECDIPRKRNRRLKRDIPTFVITD